MRAPPTTPADLNAALSSAYAAPSSSGVRGKNRAYTTNKKWSQMTLAEIKRYAKGFKTDLDELRDVFNTTSAVLGLGVKMNTDALKSSIDNGELDPVRAYYELAAFGGRIYPNQLRTALQACAKMVKNPKQSGIILGGMQSGKTGTSLSLQFFGPIFYLISEIKTYPLFLLTSHTSHEKQTQDEFNNFLTFYGKVKFTYKNKSCTLLRHLKGATVDDIISDNPALPEKVRLEPLFAMNPTLNAYRSHVIGKEHATELRVNDFIRRRVGGKRVDARLRAFIRGLADKGYAPLVFVDESQHGASSKNGEPENVAKMTEEEKRKTWCVLRQNLAAIEEAIGEVNGKLTEEVRLVCLSATPFDIQEFVNQGDFWEVRQELPKNYIGYNVWLGGKIDENANIKPPKVMNFDEYGRHNGVDFLRYICLTNYKGIRNGKMRWATFNKWSSVQESGYTTQYTTPRTPEQQKAVMIQYADRVERHLSKLLNNLASLNGGKAQTGKPLGICVRLFNDNAMTRTLLAKLKLDQSKIEVLNFFDHTQHDLGMSVKQFIAHRASPNLPYLIVVTSKARMGDSFPVEVEQFIDFSNAQTSISKSSTMNALLQGLLGRACGANKNSTVCLSPGNVETINDYLAVRGKLRHNPSQHAVMGDGWGQRRVHKMAKISADSTDPVIRRVMERVNKEIMPWAVDQVSPKLVTRHDGYVPLWKIFEEEGLFDYLEANPKAVFEGAGAVKGTFKLLRLNDVLTHEGQEYRFRFPGGERERQLKEKRSKRITFNPNAPVDAGLVYAGFRSNLDDNNRIHRVRGDTGLEFQINVAKLDARGRRIDDEAKPCKRRVATVITLPLRTDVTVLSDPAERPLPGRNHALEGRIRDPMMGERKAIFAEQDRVAEERRQQREERRRQREERETQVAA